MKRFKKAGIVTGLLLAPLVIFSVWLNTGVAQAATDASWDGPNVIKVNGTSYTDCKVSGKCNTRDWQTFQYAYYPDNWVIPQPNVGDDGTLLEPSQFCTVKNLGAMAGKSFVYGTNGNYLITTIENKPNGLDCVSGRQDRLNIGAKPSAAGLGRINGTTDTFGTAGTCDSTVKIAGPTNSTVSVDSDRKFDTKQTLKPGDYTVTVTCLAPAGQGQDGTKIPQTIKVTVAAGQTVTAVGTINQGTNTDDEDSGDTTGCDFGGNPLTWIVCPLVGAAEQFINTVDNFITSSLDFKTDTVFGDNSQYYVAWNSFRILATALLIIAGLVMVSSQAFGFEFLDAYTIRKVLPRLAIAIIGISLSWPIMELLIKFFNTLGYDIRSIIYAPFSGLKEGGTLGGSVLAIGNGALLATIIALGIGGALSLLVTAALAILVGFIIIVVRDLALTVIILVAPIAIACYILPNTQKVWKLWSDNFLGLLLVFPIISAFIAAGRVFSAVSLSPGAGNGAVGGGTAAQIIGFAAYFIPYFLLPIAFRLATGIVGTLAGFVNDRGRGAFDRLKKYRGNTIAKNMHDVKAGSRYNPDSALTKALGGRAVNRVGSHVGAGTRGRFGFGATGAAARSNNAYATADQLAKENAAFGAQMNNEDAMIAVAMGNDRQKLEGLSWFRDSNGNVNEAKLNAALAAGRSVGSNQRTQVAALDAVARSGKVINSRSELNSVLDSVSHGNGSMRGGLKGQYQFTSRQSGRGDIGRDTAHESIRELDMSTASRLKPKAVENLFGTRTVRDPQTGRYVQQSEFHEAILDASSPAERQHMYDVLYAAQYSTYTTPESQAALAETIATVQGDPFWQQAELNYGSKMNPQNRQQQQQQQQTPPPPQGSDIRLKRDIHVLHKTDTGIQLYRFKYLWSDETYVGVMAQDLLQTHPEAVIIDEFGFYKVDYSVLGLEMLTYDAWLLQSAK